MTARERATSGLIERCATSGRAKRAGTARRLFNLQSGGPARPIITRASAGAPRVPIRVNGRAPGPGPAVTIFGRTKQSGPRVGARWRGPLAAGRRAAAGAGGAARGRRMINGERGAWRRPAGGGRAANGRHLCPWEPVCFVAGPESCGAGASFLLRALVSSWQAANPADGHRGAARLHFCTGERPTAGHLSRRNSWPPARLSSGRPTID